MNRMSAGTGRPPLRRGAAVAVLLALAGCGSSGPPPVTYILGTPAPVAAGVEPLTGRPVVEVKPVLVPDYLDVSDILVRRGESAVVPSQTGRWGERLSAGATRALAMGLVRRLPGLVVTTTAPAEPPARQVLVEFETFEARADGMVVLIARWRVLGGAGHDALAGERVSLTEPVAGPGDAEVVAAMTRAIEELAERVAAGVRRATPATRGRR